MRMGNAYLTLAYRAICEEARPLSPSEMLDVAREKEFLPKHLHGATMHKTLSARLAEHIREKSGKSIFYRTSPNIFFLHSLANDPGTPEDFKKVFIGSLRSKAIRNERVLVAPRSFLQDCLYGEFIQFNEEEFLEIYRNKCSFVNRQEAELDNTVKQFVTFTLFVHGKSVLIHRRGKFSTASDELKGQISVGFGGHVNEDDFTLFSVGSDAFRANAARELREELFLDELYDDFDKTKDRTRILGYVNVDDSLDAEHHVAVLVVFDHDSNSLPRKGELSINQLAWHDTSKRINDLSEFDLWSAMIVRNVQSGRIKLTS